MNKSKQRDSIMEYLQNSYDHPTAETVFLDLRQELPNISLATVYRNLSQLADLGMVLRISTGTGPDHFDGHTHPHHHFICERCQSLLDLDMDDIDHIDEIASKQFNGKIKGHRILFYGLCPDCMKSA